MVKLLLTEEDQDIVMCDDPTPAKCPLVVGAVSDLIGKLQRITVKKIDLQLCGTNGLTNFTHLFGLDLRDPGVKLLLYEVTALALVGAGGVRLEFIGGAQQLSSRQ